MVGRQLSLFVSACADPLAPLPASFDDWPTPKAPPAPESNTRLIDDDDRPFDDDEIALLMTDRAPFQTWEVAILLDMPRRSVVNEQARALEKMKRRIEMLERWPERAEALLAQWEERR